MTISTPKLPARWQARAREVQQTGADHAELAQMRVFDEVYAAQSHGIKIQFYPVQMGNQWTVAIFLGARFHATLGSYSMVQSIIWAERLASNFPSSSVIDEQGKAEPVEFNLTRLSDLAGRVVPPREFIVPDLIPAGRVTGLYGDGGVGKSMAAMQLNIACTTGRRWMNFEPKPGPCIYVTAEEDMDEFQLRAETIAARAGLRGIDEVSDLHVESLLGKEALLAMPDPETGILNPTPLFEALEERVREVEPVMVTIDTLADVYGGDFMNPNQIKRFTNLLNRLTIPSKAAVLVLAHPSVSGMTSGTGTAHSVTWNNSFRARLYFFRNTFLAKDGKIVEPDPDARTLTNKKSNYGKPGAGINLRWRDGVFVPADDKPLALPSPQKAAEAAGAAEAKAEAKFLDLLDAYALDGRFVGAVPSNNYAPSVFAKDERREGIGKPAFVGAMNRLFAAKLIAIEEYGSASRRLKRLVRTAP